MSFTNTGNSNGIFYGKNVDFTGNSQPAETMVADGQLLIGSSVAPKIRIGTLTGSGGITITPGAGTINISSSASATDLHVAKWIVNSASNSGGNESTIQAAIDAATSGDTIFVMPGLTGIYAENLTLKAGVNITAFIGDGLTPTVTISGTCTLTTAGTVTISGIRLQTNSAALIVVSGNAASILNLVNCYLNCSNTTGITYSSSNASSAINILYCSGDIGTTGISLFTNTSTGTMSIKWSEFTNSGGSSTTSSASAGSFVGRFSKFFFSFTTTSTAGFTLESCNIDSSSTNTACLTIGGSGVNKIGRMNLNSGTASSVSVSATIFIIQVEVISSNANALTGAGTMNYAFIAFAGSSSATNISTQTALATLV